MPEKKEKMVSVTIRLTPAQHAYLKKLRQTQGTSIQHAVTKALESYIKKG